MDDQYRILIIDDEEVVLDSCTQILAGSNYQTATASSGSEGLALIEEFQPDLIFVDLKMPGIPGLEVLQSIQTRDPTIVTIVITGYATVSSAVDAMKLGAFDFLPKPFTPDEFRLITHRGLEKRQLVLETLALRREKELLRENFAAIVSHELKAPLGAVQQNLFVLEAELSGKLSEDQQTRLGRMKVRISDLVQLIHTWLKAISADIELIKERFEPTTLATVISKAVESIQPHAERKDIEIVTSLEEPLSSVCGDEGTLIEALVNLGNNAIKYSYAGSKVFIDVREENGQVAISVSDTGVGISEEDLPHIFDDFYRGKSGLAKQSGSGLGLALSRRIIELHDGSISVDSKLGEGSTFVVRLPTYRRDLQLQPEQNTEVMTSPQ